MRNRRLSFLRNSSFFKSASLVSLVLIGGCASNQIDQVRMENSFDSNVHDRAKASPRKPSEIVVIEGYNPESGVPVKGHRDLSLKKAIALTLSTNPELGIADAQEEDARIGVEIEKADYAPQVDLTVSRGKENTYTETASTTGVDRSEVNVTVRQTIFDFGAIRSAVKRRQALHESASLRKKESQEKVAFEVLKSYMNYLRQVDLVTSSARNVAAHKKIAKLVRVSQEGGNATVADVKRVETRLDAANSAKISNDNALKDSGAAFRRITELDPSRIKRPRNLVPKHNAAAGKDTKYNIVQNPQLRSLEADRYSLEQQLAQQRAKIYPQLFALGEANYNSNVAGETGVNRDAKAMLVFRLRLFDGGRKRKRAQQIEQRILEADAQHQKLYRELTQNFEQNEQVLSTNQEKFGFLRDGVAAANKVTKLYTQQFQAGTRSPFELLDAQRDLHRAEQEVINHRYDSTLASYNALRLRGGLVASLI